MSRLLSILGPTAGGKSAVALALAERLNGEIISCDSMQVYRGMNIGTATPAAEELARVPHHLVSTLDIDQPYDVATFREQATVAIEGVLARGRQPILCGGTGYYAKVLLYGLPLPPADPEVAEQVRQDAEEHGEEALRAELAAIDPASAERVGDHMRRLQRAVEIVRITGQPVPDLEADAEPPPFAGPQIILMPDIESSHARIASRTHAMLAAGWIEESAELIERGLLATPTAAKALGYPEIAAWLADGAGDRAALADELIIRTRQYARRQRTWFRHQHPGALTLPVDRESTADSLAEQLLQAL